MRPTRFCTATVASLIAAAAFSVAWSIITRTAAAQPTATNEARSREAFLDLSKVLQHPRCLNCHTSVDHPRQGDDQHRHAFNVKRGPDDRGAVGLRCQACHQDANQGASGVPGAQGWRLAPLRMAWDGLSQAQLCRALLDPAGGGMTPATLVDHLDRERLVAWAWQPGWNSRGELRAPPPLSHAEFVALARTWAELGASCPE